MISLKSRYLLTKVLWGILFIITGIAKIIMNQTTNSTIETIINIVCWIMFIIVIAISFFRRKEKVEPEDELATLNKLKAKSLIYDTIFVLMVIYLVFGRSFSLTVNSGVAFIGLGLFQIFEYIFFEHYEKKQLVDDYE
ncbi:hypothetical protein [Clostridium cylindrosporum]|uniref:Uncharacterized protein n=1 Tax=Clostridium cylindrosporum DSM 605 TaxID=1121307 RepID=A0A0J8D669_CLOCY|nr:hypothetical protein [Clostridium cylindrosporum]KMT21590.1 hypothetical protein CLCY_2c03520 [Clostridium cylindrosporum DSM 605]